MNEVVGVISVYVSNMVYLMNGFTWLTIVLGCDSISDRDSNTEERQYREYLLAKIGNKEPKDATDLS